MTPTEKLRRELLASHAVCDAEEKAVAHLLWGKAQRIANDLSNDYLIDTHNWQVLAALRIGMQIGGAK